MPDRLPISHPKNPIQINFYNRTYGLITLFLTALVLTLLLFSPPNKQEVVQALISSTQVQEYDAIVFGDEVPGIMTALKLRRQLPNGKIALITEGDISQGLGGHLVRGGLAYLDRNQVPRDIRQDSGLRRFASSSKLYDEFIQITGTQEIALDRFRADKAFRRALEQAQVKVIGNVQVQSVQTQGVKVQSFTTADQGIFTAKYFIDCTQGGKLAEMAGVRVYQGFEALGLPDSSLAIGLIFEIYGINLEQLRDIEDKMIDRFLDQNDIEAQRWLGIASGGSPGLRQQIISSFNSSNGIASIYQGTPDSADVRSSALGAAFHGMNGLVYDLRKAGAKLDRANVAILRDHLSLNSMLFYADGKTSRQLSLNGAKPTPEMLVFARKVQDFYRNLGAWDVKLMSELYIRSAGHIARSMDDLTATEMAGGGISNADALGTFTYHLDVRGGITGIGEMAARLGIDKLNIHLNMHTFNYGFRHTLPKERDNLAVLSPASGFGGLGISAGRIVEFNISVGEGLAIAVAKAVQEKRSLHSITNKEVRQTFNYTPLVYGRRSPNYESIKNIEVLFKQEQERQSQESNQHRAKVKL